VTEALGLFADQGLDVTMRPREAGESAIGVLQDGSFDVALTGIMRSLVAADNNEADFPLAFIEVNSRDGFVLLSKQPVGNFSLRDLEDHSVISFREPPTPWMALLHALKQQQVDETKVDIQVDRSIPEAVEAFKRGEADYLEIPEPVAQQLIVDGHGHLATSMGLHVGTVPYSSFAALPHVLTERADEMLRFTRALYAGQRWIAEHSARDVAEQASKHITGHDLDVVEAGVARYKAQNTWALDPLLRPEGFYLLRDILANGGLIKGGQRYEDQVVTTFAETVMLEHAGG
jgi:NitT/TauT family transport system substrate-binding protein